MNDTIDTVRGHYSASGLTEKVIEALAKIGPVDRPLTAAALAPLDQFHTRGLLATKELAALAQIDRTSAVLDLGCGIGGPARYLASTFGCSVTGLDLSADFVDAANYLTKRCDLSDRVRFRVGNALDLPFDDGAFDVVFLQHVVMNIEDRKRLYAEVRRVLVPNGRLATYDVVLREGDIHFPVPWARDPRASFLLTEEGTRSALASAGFRPLLWRDDTAAAQAWFAAVAANPPPAGPTLAVILGPDFTTIAANHARNIRENRVGILCAVLERSAGVSEA